LIANRWTKNIFLDIGFYLLRNDCAYQVVEKVVFSQALVMGSRLLEKIAKTPKT
jgi:hypothetical protein